MKQPFKNKKGQSLTEFLAFVLVIMTIIMVHAQLSLNHVVSSFVRYTSFMAARAEAVQTRAGQAYVEALVGTQANQKLNPIARTLPPETGSYVSEDVSIPFEVFNYLPGMESLSKALTSPVSTSTITTQPRNNEQGYFDNEVRQ